MQAPVFVYLDTSKPEHRILKNYIVDNKLNYLELDGEYLWPGFLICEQNEEVSRKLLQISHPFDQLAEIKCTKNSEIASDEGVLVHFFGTNLFSRLPYADLIPFETICITAELTKLKKDSLMTKFVKASFYFYKILNEKEQEITLSNYKKAENRLVYIEDKATNKKSFAVVLKEYI